MFNNKKSYEKLFFKSNKITYINISFLRNSYNYIFYLDDIDRVIQSI